MTTSVHTDRPLDGQVALVTGGASGIGAALCERLRLAGARVYSADRSHAPDRTTDPAGGRRLALDVTDEPAWERVMGTVLSEAGRLDILVNSAGISRASPLPDTTLAEWREVLGTNLDGAFLATRHALRAMRERGGVLIHIGSASGIRPAAGAAAYSTSKAALGMLVRSAAKECRAAGWKVRVNLVSPAGVRTPMWTGMPFFQELIRTHGSEDAAYAAMAAAGGGEFLTPDQVAEVVVFLAGPGGVAITGVDVPVDGGYVL